MKQRSSVNKKPRRLIQGVFGAALLLLMLCAPVSATNYAGEAVDAARSVSRAADVIVSAKISGLSDVQESFHYADGRVETADYLKVTATVSKVWKDGTGSVDTAVTFFVLKGETIEIPLTDTTAQSITVDGVDSAATYQAIKDKGAEVLFFLKVKYLPDDKSILVAKDYAVQAALDGQYDAGPVSTNQNHIIFEKELLTTFFDFSNNQRDTPPAWLEGRMEVLNILGIFQGYPDGLLRPNQDISREEFVTLLSRIFSFYDETAVCSFQDVSTGDWFYPYVASAQKAGLLKGVSSNQFGAGQSITRQDAVTLIARAMVKYQSKQLPDEVKTTEILSGFTDAAAIGDYAKTSIALLVEEKVISGYAEGNSLALRPANLITRAEICQILYFVKFH